MSENYTNEELLDPNCARKLVMDTLCSYSEETQTYVENECVYFPQYEIRVDPRVGQVKEHMAVIHFYIDSPRWTETFFETSAGSGSDTRTAIGTAMVSFMFGFLKAVMCMNAQEGYHVITSKFVNQEHKWKMYESNMIGFGKKDNEQSDVDKFWNMLGEDIIKRLGNQKHYYVKVFGSKYMDDVTAEVRINDVVSDEMSAKVASYVSTWPGDVFSSQKQFFFLEQFEETRIPDPYAGWKNYDLLKEKVKTAVDIYMELGEKEETYDDILPTMEKVLQDKTLAYECFYFLPEICTENALNGKMKLTEFVLFYYPDNHSEKIYKSQLSNYDRVGRVLFDLFNQGVFGEKTNDIYSTFVGSSATCNAYGEAVKGGSDPMQCVNCTTYFYRDGYIFR